MEIKAFAFSQQGESRGINEDRYIIDTALGLFGVFDGLGGQNADTPASEIAANIISSFIAAQIGRLPQPDKIPPGDLSAKKLLEDAINQACSEIFSYASRYSDCRGMGTALSTVLVYGRYAIIGHVGDSRVYLLRDKKVEQLSKDHTFIQEMIDAGTLSAEEGQKSPFAHVLTRSVGLQQCVQVDVLQVELLPGDRLLICSDGLSDKLSDRPTLESLMADKLDKAPEILVRQSFLRGTNDDSTALILEACGNAEAPAEKERVDCVNMTMAVLKKLYIFKELAADELMRVAQICRLVNGRSGEVLMKAGEPGDSMYMILRGVLQVSRNGKVFADLGPGNHVGEMSLLSGTPRTADVKALSSVTLLELKQSDFARLLLENSKMGVRLLMALSSELSKRLSNTNEQLYKPG